MESRVKFLKSGLKKIPRRNLRLTMLLIFEFKPSFARNEKKVIDGILKRSHFKEGTINLLRKPFYIQNVPLKKNSYPFDDQFLRILGRISKVQKHCKSENTSSYLYPDLRQSIHIRFFVTICMRSISITDLIPTFMVDPSIYSPPLSVIKFVLQHGQPLQIYGTFLNSSYEN